MLINRHNPPEHTGKIAIGYGSDDLPKVAEMLVADDQFDAGIVVGGLRKVDELHQALYEAGPSELEVLTAHEPGIAEAAKVVGAWAAKRYGEEITVSDGLYYGRVRRGGIDYHVDELGYGPLFITGNLTTPSVLEAVRLPELLPAADKDDFTERHRKARGVGTRLSLGPCDLPISSVVQGVGDVAMFTSGPWPTVHAVEVQDYRRKAIVASQMFSYGPELLHPPQR